MLKLYVTAFLCMGVYEQQLDDGLHFNQQSWQMTHALCVWQVMAEDQDKAGIAMSSSWPQGVKNVNSKG